MYTLIDLFISSLKGPFQTGLKLTIYVAYILVSIPTILNWLLIKSTYCGVSALLQLTQEQLIVPKGIPMIYSIRYPVRMVDVAVAIAITGNAQRPGRTMPNTETSPKWQVISSMRYHRCTACSWNVVPRKNGTLWKHRAAKGDVTYCTGSGQLPQTNSVLVKMRIICKEG